jgi:hypothetical protein
VNWECLVQYPVYTHSVSRTSPITMSNCTCMPHFTALPMPTLRPTYRQLRTLSPQQPPLSLTLVHCTKTSTRNTTPPPPTPNLLAPFLTSATSFSRTLVPKTQAFIISVSVSFPKNPSSPIVPISFLICASTRSYLPLSSPPVTHLLEHQLPKLPPSKATYLPTYPPTLFTSYSVAEPNKPEPARKP